MRIRRAKRNTALALVTGASAALFACSDEPTEPSALYVPPVAPPSFTLNDLPGSCLGDDAVGYVNGVNKPEQMGCTANDISLAGANVSQVTTSQGTFNPAEETVRCEEGEDVSLLLGFQISQTAASIRSDMGFWVNGKGGLAVGSGECSHFHLPIPPQAGSVGYGEEDDTPDLCGDVINQTASTGTFQDPIVVQCLPGPGGLLTFNACAAWKTPNDDTFCPIEGQPAPDGYREGTLPLQKSKCVCNDITVPVVVTKKATLEVVKECSPASDPGTFDLLIDGDNQHADDVACGGSTGTQDVSAGDSESPGEDHTFAEADFDTEEYTSSWACTEDGAASSSGTGTGPETINVQPDKAYVCTFTNVRKGTIIIEKETDPDGNTTDSFAFTQDVDGAGNFDLKDDESKTFDNVLPGAYSVSENDPTPAFDLTALVCDDDASDTPSVENVGTRTATINVDPGETVTCTFTNTQRGSITIKKETDPDQASGDFSFTQFIDGTGNFTLQDGGSKLFDDVQSDSYIVHELDPNPEFDLYRIECTNQGTTGVNIASRNVTVALAPGEDETCTFYNRRRATVTLNKTQSGSPAAGFKFEVRSGADLNNLGTTIATGTSDGSGVVEFSCSGGDPTKCDNDAGGIAQIVPGDYQVCEVDMMAGWANNINGFTPDGAIPEGSDNGVECVDVTLGAGASGVPEHVPDPVDNTPPPGGDARTIGYWKNHSCAAPGNQEDVLSPLLEGAPAIIAGQLTLNQCSDAAYLLDKRDLTSKNTKQASDACYGLAAQLIAAELNVKAGASTLNCSEDVIQTISDANALLVTVGFDGTGACRPSRVKGTQAEQRDQLWAYAATLDAFNNNDLGCQTP